MTPGFLSILTNLANAAPETAKEQLLQKFKILTEQGYGKESVFPDFFDYRNCQQITEKAYNGRRRPEQVYYLCVHQMAVAFGTRKNRRDYWKETIQNEAPPKNHDWIKWVWELEDYLKDEDHELNDIARRLALHERFRSVPYHDIAALNGDVIMNHPAELITWHGNGANGHPRNRNKKMNGSIGLGFEGHFPALLKNNTKKYNQLDEETIISFREAMKISVTKRREEGCPLEFVEHHRQHSAGRMGDAGEGIHKEVVMPLLKPLSLKVDYDRVTGKGRPVPINWDPNANHNWWGKKV